jgi:hypothetical protein
MNKFDFFCRILFCARKWVYVWRIATLTRVMENSMKRLAKKHNFCRRRMYRELDIKTPAIQAAISRARCYTKMKTSTGVISELIASAGNFKSRKKTWTTRTVTWLKKNQIPLDLTTKETVKMTSKALIERSEKRDKSIISAAAVVFMFS